MLPWKLLSLCCKLSGIHGSLQFIRSVSHKLVNYKVPDYVTLRHTGRLGNHVVSNRFRGFSNLAMLFFFLQVIWRTGFKQRLFLDWERLVVFEKNTLKSMQLPYYAQIQLFAIKIGQTPVWIVLDYSMICHKWQTNVTYK